MTDLVSDNVIIKGKGSTGPLWKRFASSIPSGESLELWTLNEDILPETSRHFDIHDCGGHHLPLIESKWPHLNNPICCYVNSVKDCGHNFYRELPKEIYELQPKEALGFLCTISYMIATAAVLKPKKVWLAGVDFVMLRRRQEERRCVQEWLYCLGGAGVKYQWQKDNSLLFKERTVFYK